MHMPSATGVRGLIAFVGPHRMLQPRRVIWAIAFLFVVGCAIVSLLDQEQATTAGPLGVLVGAGVSGALIFHGARSYTDRERLGWRLVGAGMLIAAFGVLVVGAIQAIEGSVAAFGPPDLIIIAAYFTLLTGFAIMPNLGMMLRSRVRVLLDGLIGALSMATLIWVLFGSALGNLQSATSWERFAGVAYPVLDSLMVVVAMIVTIRRSTWRFDLRVVMIGIGMVVHAMADLTYLARGIGQSFEGARPNFFLFLVAMLCYLTTAGAIRHRPRPREYADRRQPIWAKVAPYGAAVVVIGLIVARLGESQLDTDIRLLLVGGSIVIGLVVTRQAVALREYRSLVDQQRKALVASVSHELRTPLTAMVGFLDLMKDPSTEIDLAERVELTDVVHQQAMYMSRIVSDLLLLARDSSRLVLVETEVSVRKLVADTVRSARVSAEALHTEVEPGLTVRADSDRMRQALDNLIVNAFRYGGGQVLLTAAAVGSDLILEVHDNGAGVPRKYELAIWQQFERGHNRLNATVPGSGIGLAVVELVVRRHGGTATYERSKRLGGSCFRIVLPGRVIEPSKAEGQAEAAPPPRMVKGLSV
jgi:signal transduction histidine kinase